MKFITAVLLTALLAFVAGFWLPWWTVAIASFAIACLIPQRPGRAYLSGFMGILVLWCGLAWWIDIKNQGILSSKVALLLPLGGSSVLLIFVSGLIGAIVGGFGALSGSFLRSSNNK